jgi:predicted site-specific integrase-resolvase
MEPLTTKQAAPIVGVSVGTLQNWRVKGVGPMFRKAGSKVLYEPSDIQAWKAANRYASTAEVG